MKIYKIYLILIFIILLFLIVNANDIDYKNKKIIEKYCKKCLNFKGKKKKYIYCKKCQALKNSISLNIKPLDDTPLKLALCAIAKNENLYIREWIEYYKMLGINKIILYDNNEVNGEKFEDVINDYIENGFVEIVDRRGIVIQDNKYGKSTQGKAYHDCYYNNYKNYDWLLFFDIDEFLAINYKYKNIYEFLNDFNNYDGIKVQWKMYGDNENLHYENKPVIERFLSPTNFAYHNEVKTILKCKEYQFELKFGAHGVSNKEPIVVNMKKKRVKVKNFNLDIKKYKDLPVYLNHFYSKSTEEYIQRKFNKTDATFGRNHNSLNYIKRNYFRYNKFTKEKDEMFNSLVNIN